MNVTTVVCRYGVAFPGRYCAFVVLDGDVTSWDCSHLHHTPTAAAKCLRRLEREAWVFLTSAMIVRVSEAASADPEPLYEATVTYSSLERAQTGRTSSSRRFRRPYAAVTPLTESGVS